MHPAGVLSVGSYIKYGRNKLTFANERGSYEKMVWEISGRDRKDLALEGISRALKITLEEVVDFQRVMADYGVYEALGWTEPQATETLFSMLMARTDAEGAGRSFTIEINK
jgi:hypothetical protein